MGRAQASIAMRKQRAQEFSAAHAQDLSAMRERVQATPRATFWTKEERQQIEELRGDPDELRARAEQQARERAEAYRQDKKDAAQRRGMPRARSRIAHIVCTGPVVRRREGLCRTTAEVRRSPAPRQRSSLLVQAPLG